MEPTRLSPPVQVMLIFCFSGPLFFPTDHSEHADSASTTDPGGRSDETDVSVQESGATSYRTWDTRSPACSSGSEGGEDSDFSMGGLSVGQYYSQV